MSITVAVTGVGAITALGATANATWERLVRGERAFRAVTLFDAAGHRSNLVAEIDGIAPCDPVTSSRTTELALAAAREALEHAALPSGGRIGLVVGGTTAGLLETESLLGMLLGPKGVDPEARVRALSQMLNHPLNAATDRLAKELGPFVRARSLSSACSTGANAIMVGATWLELGLADAVLCGASDALCRVTLAGFNALGAIDPEGARPFDVKRRGLTLGEGAGFVVLERAHDVARRGGRVVCTLLGWASRAEAHHITNPEPTGSAPARAMTAALARAGLGPADIDYVNAHGTGTPLNDPMESKAILRVFGDEVKRVPVSSVKGAIGHTLAAAGAVEAVLTALAIDRGMIPPTAALTDPDPACPLVHVTSAEARSLRAAITSSFGFGGMDTVLVLGAPDRIARGAPAARRVVVTGRAEITPEADADVVALPEGELDADKARRLDRASRFTAAACRRALGPSTGDYEETGLILGSAFGSPDATSAFMRRLVEKGARLVPPAEFPSLVPSSPAGHASIYLGLGGPTFVVADLSTSGECAFLQGWELVAAGEVDRTCVAAAEGKSVIVDAVFRVVFGQQEVQPRKEGAAAIVLEAEDTAKGKILARVAWTCAWVSDKPEIPPPTGRSLVVLANPSPRATAVVDQSPWSACPRRVVDAARGAHEAMGAVAISRAVDAIVSGECDEVLFVGSDRGWGYGGILCR